MVVVWCSYSTTSLINTLVSRNLLLLHHWLLILLLSLILELMNWLLLRLERSLMMMDCHWASLHVLVQITLHWKLLLKLLLLILLLSVSHNHRLNFVVHWAWKNIGHTRLQRLHAITYTRLYKITHIWLHTTICYASCLWLTIICNHLLHGLCHSNHVSLWHHSKVIHNNRVIELLSFLY